jgi:sterol desaturase/sphingolipid hydroxylase (fatty acid hydroxylase superfamily)
VAAFRAEYRREHVGPRYRGRLHLGFTVLVCLATIGASLLALDAPTAGEWVTVPLTFLYANLVEYFGHRGPMHNRARGLGLIFERHVLQHHRFFRDDAMAFDGTSDYKAVLFPPVMILFYLVGFALPAGLLLAWLSTANVALLFVATAVAYFLNYELLHFAYHADPDSRLARLPLMDRLRRLHTLHHRPSLMQKRNFNITYPIGDWLFGTLHREDPAEQTTGRDADAPAR